MLTPCKIMFKIAQIITYLMGSFQLLCFGCVFQNRVHGALQRTATVYLKRGELLLMAAVKRLTAVTIYWKLRH